LKATLLSGNYRELAGMRDVARVLGVPFTATRLVAPAIDGGPAPQQWMVNPAQAAELDALLAPEVHPDTAPGQGGAVLTCAAGTTTCAITPSGEILPCILLRRAVGSIRKRSLYEIWHGDPDPFLERLRRLEPEDVRECHACASRQRCLCFPGIAYTETGELTGVPPSSCRLAMEQK